jgi:hypothetical protein
MTRKQESHAHRASHDATGRVLRRDRTATGRDQGRPATPVLHPRLSRLLDATIVAKEAADRPRRDALRIAKGLLETLAGVPDTRTRAEVQR